MNKNDQELNTLNKSKESVYKKIGDKANNLIKDFNESPVNDNQKPFYTFFIKDIDALVSSVEGWHSCQIGECVAAYNGLGFIVIVNKAGEVYPLKKYTHKKTEKIKGYLRLLLEKGWAEVRYVDEIHNIFIKPSDQVLVKNLFRK